ncbi:DeoR/GlpR family DNA-binding transcription regulator [Aquisalinus flavus]|nr:DeoR/GlpR family DNA-binding transcription regulator [Aquisalinus flavus]
MSKTDFRSTGREEQMQTKPLEGRDEDRLFIHDRWNRIVDLLRVDSVTSVEQLADDLSVSAATIRRDLSELDAVGRLKRVRGGAVAASLDSAKPQMTSTLRTLQGQLGHADALKKNREAKLAIGRKAAELLDAGEAVIIDGGTTTLELANAIDVDSLTVLTTSILIMNALLLRPDLRVLIAGGEIFHEQSVVLNPYGNGIVSKYSATKIFIGAQAITSRGLMQTDPLLVHNEQELIERAEKVIVLVDSSKFGAKASLSVCGLDRIDVIVTDDGLAPEARRMLQDFDIEILTVPLAG